MKKTQTGSPNGISVVKYVIGETYDLPDSFYEVFVNQLGVAEPVIADREDKMITSYENKSIKAEERKETSDKRKKERKIKK